MPSNNGTYTRSLYFTLYEVKTDVERGRGGGSLGLLNQTLCLHSRQKWNGLIRFQGSEHDMQNLYHFSSRLDLGQGIVSI